MHVNTKFESNNLLLQVIPQFSSLKLGQGAAGNKSSEELDAEVQKQRSNVIDAVCVRVMKARKVEHYNILVQTIIKQINMFKAQPPLIKKRVESLVDREFLERDKDDRTKYIYRP